MPTIRRPRKGSMQYWPRKRAKKHYPKMRSWGTGTEAAPLGFAGYKAGMTHITIVDNSKHSLTRNTEVTVPVTVIECPPLRVAGVKTYKKVEGTLKQKSTKFAKADKALARKINVSKKERDTIDLGDADDIRLIVQTQPGMTGLGKKKPELFELPLGGTVEEKAAFAKENLGKEIVVSDAIKEGQQVDVSAITKGKGYQGPVKRFGVSLRTRKSEKTKRGPGSLGPWKGQGHIMYRVAHAGQMGYHQRKDLNKWVLKISDSAKEINPKGGFLRYGEIKNQYIIIKGSVPGPTKRLVMLTSASRPDKGVPAEAPSIEYVSLKSKQGR